MKKAKKAREPGELTAKQAVIAAALEKGITHTDIAKGMGVTRPAVSIQAGKLTKKAEKWDFTAPKLLSLAWRAQKAILDAATDPKAAAKLTFPLKGSDVGSAIDRSIDRAQPKVNVNANLNASLSLTPEAEARFRERYWQGNSQAGSGNAIDVTGNIPPDNCSNK